MKSLGISRRLGKAADPQVCVNLNGYEGTEELKKVILVIEDCLEKNFPGVQVNRIGAIRKLFQEEGMTLPGLETRSEGTMTIPGLETP